MNYDQPDRYDLSGDCDGESSRCRAKMERASNGDYVSHDDYCELLAAYGELEKRLNQIADLVR